jgi:hypothetical protein
MGRKKEQINDGCMMLIFILAAFFGIMNTSFEVFVIVLIVGMFIGSCSRVLR